MAGMLDTYKYELKVNGIVVYRGVTNDLERRKSEHRTRWPKFTNQNFNVSIISALRPRFFA